MIVFSAPVDEYPKVTSGDCGESTKALLAFAKDAYLLKDFYSDDFYKLKQNNQNSYQLIAIPRGKNFDPNYVNHIEFPEDRDLPDWDIYSPETTCVQQS